LPVIAARRAEVSQALNLALEDTDGNTCTAGVRAAKTWGTKENVEPLIRQVREGGPFSTPLRVAAMEALVAIKDERGVWPIALWLGDFFNGQTAEAMVRKLGPVAEKVALEHLEDFEAPARSRAWTVLGLVGTRGSVGKMKAAADKETDAGVRNTAAASIRLAQVRP
jgi:HEAT repeat protein